MGSQPSVRQEEGRARLALGEAAGSRAGRDTRTHGEETEERVRKAGGGGATERAAEPRGGSRVSSP